MADPSSPSSSSPFSSLFASSLPRTSYIASNKETASGGVKAAEAEVPGFEKKSAFEAGFKSGLTSSIVGLLFSAVRNSLEKHDRGAWGVLTRTGGTIGLVAGMGFLFSYTDQTLANIRGRDDDGLNGAAGGCAAGFLAGVRNRSLGAAFGGCMILGAAVGTFELAGKTVGGLQSGGDGTGIRLTQEQREASRLSFFKKGSEPILPSNKVSQQD